MYLESARVVLTSFITCVFARLAYGSSTVKEKNPRKELLGAGNADVSTDRQVCARPTGMRLGEPPLGDRSSWHPWQMQLRILNPSIDRRVAWTAPSTLPQELNTQTQ